MLIKIGKYFLLTTHSTDPKYPRAQNECAVIDNFKYYECSFEFE